MSETYKITAYDPLPILGVQIFGYGNEENLSILAEEVQKHLQQGKRQLIFDFSQCKIVNSTGISVLLELLMTIKEEYQGTVFFTALSQLLVDAFTFSGVITLVEPVATFDEALAQAKQAA